MHLKDQCSVNKAKAKNIKPVLKIHLKDQYSVNMKSILLNKILFLNFLALSLKLY